MGLYKEEQEERRGERRSGERRSGERRGEERRGEERRRRKKRRRRTLFWLLIIALVSLVFSVLTGNLSIIIEKFYKYKDESYRPMDTDRMKYEQEKANPLGKK
jgi:predicted nucleic acid-binding Zn ribbon protein